MFVLLSHVLSIVLMLIAMKSLMMMMMMTMMMMTMMMLLLMMMLMMMMNVMKILMAKEMELWPMTTILRLHRRQMHDQHAIVCLHVVCKSSTTMRTTTCRLGRRESDSSIVGHSCFILRRPSNIKIASSYDTGIKSGNRRPLYV
jgi:hypothetical protein